MKQAWLLIAAAAPAPSPVPTGAAPAGIEVTIENVRSNQGMVLVQICPEKQFPGRCAIGGRVAARPGTVTVTLPHVPPGTYAAMAFHDRNGNGTLDRWLGIPKEDFGFSRMARLPLRPPRFRDAQFVHDATEQKLSIRLDNYFG